MRSGARSGSDGSTSVEAGRRVGASMKSRLAQPPRIVDVFDALRPSVRARWVWRELYANYPSARHGWDGAEQWPWADRSISNRRKPRDSDRDVPSCVVTYPYPATNISNLAPCQQLAAAAESYLHLSFRGRGSHTNAPNKPAPIWKEKTCGVGWVVVGVMKSAV